MVHQLYSNKKQFFFEIPSLALNPSIHYPLSIHTPIHQPSTHHPSPPTCHPLPFPPGILCAVSVPLTCHLPNHHLCCVASDVEDTLCAPHEPPPAPISPPPHLPVKCAMSSGWGQYLVTHHFPPVPSIPESPRLMTSSGHTVFDVAFKAMGLLREHTSLPRKRVPEELLCSRGISRPPPSTGPQSCLLPSPFPQFDARDRIHFTNEKAWTLTDFRPGWSISWSGGNCPGGSVAAPQVFALLACQLQPLPCLTGTAIPSHWGHG